MMFEAFKYFPRIQVLLSLNDNLYSIARFSENMGQYLEKFLGNCSVMTSLQTCNYFGTL